MAARSSQDLALTRELQDLAELIRTLDGRGIARAPRRGHGLDGVALEMSAPDLHGAQAPRLSEPADQPVERVACIAARLQHGGRDQGLTMLVRRLVPA